MKGQTLFRVVATLVILVFAGGIWLTGTQPTWAWLDVYSYAAVAGVTALWLWETFLWRLSLSQRLRLAPRDVRGTWVGTLTPLTSGGELSTSSDPKTVYLVIRQTATTVKTVLLTDASRSVSSLASINSDDETASLAYLYSGLADLRHRHRSPIHNGSCSRSITGVPVTRLKGWYWTDRNSQGELDFGARAEALAEDFAAASGLFE